MKAKIARLIIIGLMLASPMGGLNLVVFAQAPQTYAFVFKDAEISQIAEEILGKGLGVAYRVEPGVTGRMNFRIEQRLTKAQLLAAFEAALASYDIALVQDGGTLVLKPSAKAQTGGTISTSSTGSKGVGYQLRAVPINYASASEVAKVLESVTRSRLVLYSSDSLSLILLGGRGEEIDNAVNTIELFDQSSLSGAKIRFYPLQNSDVQTVALELDQIIRAADVKTLRIVPMQRLNGLFAFSKSTEVLDELGQWVTRLDVPSTDENLKIYVYRPRGASAETLAKTLNQVLGLSYDTGFTNTNAGTSASSSQSGTVSQSSSQPSQSNQSNSGMRIVADKDTNTIIINAPEAIRRRALNVLDQIDREPAQIFIEASILEVSLTDDFSYGVDWKKLDDGKKLTISSYSGETTNFAASAPGFSVSYVGSDISAVIRALSSKSKVKIVSAPKIATVENATAKLQVGDQVPIVTQSSQSTQTANATLVNTVDYRDTGVLLQVTPRLTGEGRISLEVSQEVSSVAKTQTSGIDSPTIKQRRLESKLIVPEGTVVALGGLISATESESDGGTPYLKDIPFLGSLFKGKSVSNARTEVVVLLQVKIIRSPDEQAGIIANLDADIKEAITKGTWLGKAQ